MTESWEETVEDRSALCDECGRRRTCPAAYNVDVVCPEKEHEDFGM